MRLAALVGAVVLLAGVPAAHATTWQGAGRSLGEKAAWDTRGGSIKLTARDDDSIGPSYSKHGKASVRVKGHARGRGHGPAHGGFADRLGGRPGFHGDRDGGHGTPFGGTASPVPVPAGLVLIVTAAATLGAAGVRRRSSAAG